MLGLALLFPHFPNTNISCKRVDKRKSSLHRGRESKSSLLRRVCWHAAHRHTGRPTSPLFASFPFSRETTRVTVTPAGRPLFSSPTLCQSIRWPRYQLACLVPPSCVNTVLLRPRDRPRPTIPSRVTHISGGPCCSRALAVWERQGLVGSVHREHWASSIQRRQPRPTSTRYKSGHWLFAPSGRTSADKTIQPLPHAGLVEVNISQRTDRYTTTTSSTVSRPGPPREAAGPGSKASC